MIILFFTEFFRTYFCMSLLFAHHHHHNYLGAHECSFYSLCPIVPPLLLSQFESVLIHAASTTTHHHQQLAFGSAALLLVCCLSCRRLRLSPAAVRRRTTTVFFVILLPHLTNMETYNKFVAAEKPSKLSASLHSLSLSRIRSRISEWLSERPELYLFWVSKK